MDKARKKKIKRIVAAACAVVVVILLAVMPLLAKQASNSDGPKASILSGTVQTGSIQKELIGGGALAAEDAEAITVPTAVKLTKYLVANGDTVSKGDPIASVDRVTVMTAIAQVQETLDYLAEEMEAESKKDTDGTVVALAGGTVKMIYAKKGQSVQDVMLEHGALAVLSLDGLMAVDMTVSADLSVGTAVKVTLSGDKTVTGKVVANLAGKITVTLEDNGYAVGEAAKVSMKDGTPIGSGELYIYSPWNATAYTGTVSSVKVEAGEKVSAGKVLMKLSDTGYTATYQQLVSQRQEYEELLLELFEMYQTELLTAPCDGTVSGVDTDSAQLLAVTEQTYTISLLANAPNGDDATQYCNYVGQVSAVGQNGWALSVNPQNIPIADYKALSGVPLDTAAMTELVVYNPAQATVAATPVYELVNDRWVQADTGSIAAGDILLFAGDAGGNLIWIVRIQKAAADTPQPSGPSGPSGSTDNNTSTVPENSGSNSKFPSAQGSWGAMGSYPQGGIMEQEPAFTLYGLETAEVAAVTPQSTMTLDIAVDELDITALKTGMTAKVIIDALGGEKATATITNIGNTGENNGGNSKYTVELTLARSENMLIGMNATASILLETTADTLTIPTEALVETGAKTVVYTGYDKKKETLINPVTVTLGVSDGNSVQILEGLTSGQTYYYAYYDTLEISSAPDFGNGFMFGG